MQYRSSSHSAHHLSIDAQPHRDGSALVDVDLDALGGLRRWVVIVALACAVLALSAMPARSQVRPSDALVLARVCVHEASFAPAGVATIDADEPETLGARVVAVAAPVVVPRGPRGGARWVRCAFLVADAAVDAMRRTGAL